MFLAIIKRELYSQHKEKYISLYTTLQPIFDENNLAGINLVIVVMES